MTERSMDMDAHWIRSQFPALDKDWILFDNAGGSVPLGSVIERVADYMASCPVQLGASYRPSEEAVARLDDSRKALARMVGAAGDELVFGASTTSLICRLARAMAEKLRPGDEIVVTEVDHEANISPWRRLESQGVRIRTWPLNRDSQALEHQDLLPLLGDKTRLVCVTHASNILGEVVAVEDIANAVHAVGGLLCVDGVAYAPHRQIDVRKWDVDFYAFSMYKAYGPHCALMYGKRDLLLDLPNLNHDFMSREDVPGKFELGAFPFELIYGAGAVPAYLDELGRRMDNSVDTAASAYRAIGEQEFALSARLLNYLSGRADVTIHGSRDATESRLPTISFSISGRRSSEIPPFCDSDGIGIRWGHFYAPRLIDALGLTERDGVIRVSMVHYNTIEEVDRLIETLERKTV